MPFNCAHCGNSINQDQHCNCYEMVDFSNGSASYQLGKREDVRDDIMWIVKFRNGNIKKISFPILSLEDV